MSADQLVKNLTNSSSFDNFQDDRVSTTSSSPSALKSRFRVAVQAVCAAQRVASGPSHSIHDPAAASNSSSGPPHPYQWSYSGPLEPGVNPNQPQPQFAHLSNQHVSVHLVDYTDDRVRFQSFQPACESELERFKLAIDLSQSPSSSTAQLDQRPDRPSRPPWASVRWINVNGLSWDVIKLLAIRYQLHPLAVEDCLHTSARSKSEYYKQHLFVHAAVHTLEEKTDAVVSSQEKTSETEPHNMPLDTEHTLESGLLEPDINPLEPSPTYKTTEDPAQEPLKHPIMDLGTATNGRFTSGKEVFDAEREVVRQLTKDYKVRVLAEKLSIFLLRDGTLITIFSHDGSKNVVPLLARLKSMDTLLRSSADASMLLQAILDIVVDQALDVVEAFRSKLTRLEAKVLVSPDLDTVKHLHVLSGELLLLKRTLSPLSTLVHGIMNHDPSEQKITHYRATQRQDELRSSEIHSNSCPSNAGFISAQAKVYMSDVLDHIDSLLSSLELFSGLASNLVDFTFNTMSFSTNESMRQLSIVTIIFLPLTFLTGYFGMNFVKFEAIQKSDAFFWCLALPITTVMIFVFTCHGVRRRVRLQAAAFQVKSGEKTK